MVISRLCNNCLHCGIDFEIFPRLCNFLRCCRGFHVDIRLHYVIVFEFICWLCHFMFTLQKWFRIDYVIISAATVLGPLVALETWAPSCQVVKTVFSQCLVGFKGWSRYRGRCTKYLAWPLANSLKVSTSAQSPP